MVLSLLLAVRHECCDSGMLWPVHRMLSILLEPLTLTLT